MKGFSLCMAVFAAAALVGTAWAGEDKGKEALPLRLELDLVDGSRIIGIPGIESVPVQTSYAKMVVPLKQILTVKIGDDHETAAVDLRNGDKLKGVINLEPIKLETVFGKVAIGAAHIRELRVGLGGGALPEALKQGLVLYYSFDRSEGATVTDKSGKGHDGKVNAAEWTADGASGGAMAFDGTASYIEVPAHPDFAISRAISIGAWVYITEQTGHPMILGKKAGSNYVGDYLLNLFEGSRAAFHVCDQPNAKGWSFFANGVIEQKRWHHVMGTWDGSTMTIYVDGAVDTKREGVTGAISDSGRPIRIGTADNSAFFFSGKLDEIMLFNRALSEKEVKQIYDAQK